MLWRWIFRWRLPCSPPSRRPVLSAVRPALSPARTARARGGRPRRAFRRCYGGGSSDGAFHAALRPGDLFFQLSDQPFHLRVQHELEAAVHAELFVDVMEVDLQMAPSMQPSVPETCSFSCQTSPFTCAYSTSSRRPSTPSFS